MTRASAPIRARIALLVVLACAACSGSSSSSAPASSAAGPKYVIALATLAPDEGADLCRNGLFDQLKKEGFEQGRNLEVRSADAQGEIANATMIVQNFESQADVNAVVTFTTPVLSAAINTSRRKPVVFTYVTDPIAAGVGTSRTDHLPNITGVGSFPAIEDTVDVIQQIVPGIRRVGTLYNSGEANSMKILAVGRPAFEKRGISLVEVSIASTNEVLQAAQALAQRGAQAIWLGSDNTVLMAFDAVAKAATDAKLPIILNEIDPLPRGGTAAVGLGWYEVGVGTAKLVARVLRGENPKDIPIEEIAIKDVKLNHEVARRLGLTFPPDLLAKETK